MKKALQKITLLSLASIFFISCNKDGSDVNPQSVVGKWFLVSIYSNVEFKTDDPETSTEDVSGEGLYFDFAADGTYTTNGAIELGDINDNDGNVSTGKYELSKGVLSLTYDDPDLGIPVTLYLDATINGNDMTLSLNKDDLVQAFANATGVDPFTQAFVQIFLDEIVVFDYKMTLSK